MTNIFKKNDRLVEIPMEDIAPNKYQPRLYFDDEGIEELKNSIIEFGLLQPIAVRKCSGGYELISGERRFRAAQLAGMKKIPSIIIEGDEKKSAILSLLENLQREDLTFFEIAQSYERLIREQGMTQTEVAEKMGKSQLSVANKLRLLRLSPMIRKMIREYNLSEGHARALLRLKSEKQQFEAIKNICVSSLSAEEANEMTSEMLKKPKKRREYTKINGNLTFFKNTIRKAVDVVQNDGVEADLTETEFEWGTEYKICVKKESCKIK